MCDCIENVEKRLKAQDPPNNTMLLLNLLGPRRALVATCKRDDKKRQKPSYMMATFCPFCGEKYPERAKGDIVFDASKSASADVVKPVGPFRLSDAQRELCRFHGYDPDDLALARLIGTEVCEDYGQDDQFHMARIRAGDIWNDHIAVQAALSAIRITKAAR